MSNNPYESPSLEAHDNTLECATERRRHPLLIAFVGLVLGLVCGGVTGAAIVSPLFCAFEIVDEQMPSTFPDGYDPFNDADPMLGALIGLLMGATLGVLPWMLLGGALFLGASLISENSRRQLTFLALVVSAILGCSIGLLVSFRASEELWGGAVWLFVGGGIGLAGGLLGGWFLVWAVVRVAWRSGRQMVADPE